MESSHELFLRGYSPLFYLESMSELKLRPPKEPDSKNNLQLRLHPHPDSQFIKLLGRNIRRGIGHQILGGGGLGKGQNLANGFLTGQQRDDAVNPQGYAA